MTDPIKLGADAVVDRAEVVGYVRFEGKLRIFLRSGEIMIVSDTLSREKLEALSKKD